ncbi:MAG: UbiH/UbiF/VisC/COQ6 family ubiquinone biosynthesis hydroxylase [Alphaproteobacteria bacterium]|nr:UbiH/UbiF/VisC/COQ6 family ubiquinone biosynthesis hydroxylase [Alphaproteobacteria bacterium]
MTQTFPSRVDVAIVGGGPVGGALALGLARAGLSVALIEREAPPRQRDRGLDGRGWALSQGSRTILAGLGLWEACLAEAGAIRDIRVTDGPDDGGLSRLFLHYDHRTVGDEPMGWIVEAPVIRASVLAALAAAPRGVTWLTATAVTDLRPGDGGWTLSLSTGARLTTALVVGADGRGSLVRSASGIRAADWSYGQTAIVCAVRHDLPHHDTAHERFLPAGPFALLPLADPHTSSIVWTERTADADRILALPEATFERLATSRFGPSVGRLHLAGKRWRWPLRFHLAAQYCRPGLVLIGDAAHGMHPIAGQGLNLGLRDVAALTEEIVDAKASGLSPGDPVVLTRYERRRRPDTVAMMAATDMLNRLFSNDVTALRLARTLGLAAVERMPALKRLFMRQAMGTLVRP